MKPIRDTHIANQTCHIKQVKEFYEISLHLLRIMK